jgi:hypothetical protein
MEQKMPATSDVIDEPKRVPQKVTVPHKRNARSKVTNGALILAGLVDGRTQVARRYTDLVAAVCTDQGGADRMSEAGMQLARRFAALSVQAEQLESCLANGETINIQEYATLTSTLVRVVSRLGIERMARDVGLLDPLEYARRVDAQEAAAP